MLNNTNIVLGLVLGSGLDLDESILEGKKIITQEVAGVHSKIVYECRIAGKNILVFRGRKHFYEGSKPDEITENVRFALAKGVRNMLITNAAGGLSENFAVGEMMLITSHVSFNDRVKFTGKPSTINRNLNELVLSSAMKLNIKIHEGTYGYYPGPTYETKAETRFQKKFAIDAAGMSTVPEVYEAMKLGMNASAISVITNLLKENGLSATSHEDVLKSAVTANASLSRLITELISELN